MNRIVIVLCSCLLLFLFVAAMILLFRDEREHYPPSPTPHPSCIITMTTFMGFRDRFDQVEKIMKSLVSSGQEVVVINEWDANYKRYVDFMRQKFPTITFIQKSHDDQGQARSLNILVREFLLHSDKKYWIHWEDTWECSRPLVPDLVNIMDQYPNIIQLQVTEDWTKMPPNEVIDLPEAKILLPQRHHFHEKDIYQMMDDISLETWPLFSLRPSINRLSFFQRHPQDFYFLEHPWMWPLRFEWEFGRIFLRNKGIKAISKKTYARRIKGHKSTYHDMATYSPDYLTR